MKRKFKEGYIYLKSKSFVYISLNVFTVTFYQFNAYLLNNN